MSFGRAALGFGKTVSSVSFVVWSYELLLSLVLGVKRGRSSMLSAEMVRDPWRDVSCVQLPFD